MSPAEDLELAAIETCLQALRPLSEDARNRALAYLTERFNSEATANGKEGNGL